MRGRRSFRLKPIFLILFFLIIYIYVCSITLLPSNIVIFQGEELNLKTMYGVKINSKQSNIAPYNIMQTSTNLSNKGSKFSCSWIILSCPAFLLFFIFLLNH